MSLKGIDVSAHQGVVDWSAVKQAGIEFAIIRAGYGKSTVDEFFVQNITGAIVNGIHVGVYWFIYALNDTDIIKNANRFIQAITPYKRYITMKCWADFEYASEKYANKYGTVFSKEQRTHMLKLFIDTLNNNGFDCGNYTNPDYLRYKLNDLSIYPLWLSSYSKVKPNYNCDIWQYYNKGRVNGIKGDVDMDVWYEDIQEEKDITALQKMDIQKGNPQQFAQIIKNIKTALNVDFGLSFLIDETINDVLLINLANVNLSTNAYTYNTTYALTQLLKWWGYGIEPTSNYGNAVSAIISIFQSQVGITVTGTTTADTWKKLLGK